MMMRNPHHPFTEASGFSLIEISIVLVIIGLLLGGILTPLATQQEVRDIKATQQILADTQLAIYGYAYGTGFLPCPDTNADGLEDFAAGNCAALQGDAPWSTLGSRDGDKFRGNRLGYRIDATLNNRAAISCTPTASIQVCNAAGYAAGTTLTNSAAMVVWSFGKNGYGATNAQGNLNTIPPGVTLSAGELESWRAGKQRQRHNFCAGNSHPASWWRGHRI